MFDSDLFMYGLDLCGEYPRQIKGTGVVGISPRIWPILLSSIRIDRQQKSETP